MVALALGAAGVIAALALATHHAEDASWGAATGMSEIRNLVGPFGANLSYSLFETIGYVAWTVPLGLLVLAAATFRRDRSRVGAARWTGLALLVLSLAALASLSLSGLVAPDHVPPGGFMGRLVAVIDG